MEREKPSDLNDYVLRSGARSGLKRELAFAMKSHAELPSFLGRTRSGKAAAAASVAPSSYGGKRHKPSDGRADKQAISQDLVDVPISSPLGGDEVYITIHNTQNEGSPNSLKLELASPHRKEKLFQDRVNTNALVVDEIIDDLKKDAIPVEELNRDYKSSNSEAKLESSAVIIPSSPLSSQQVVVYPQASISPSENGYAVKQSGMLKARKGSKLRNRLGEKQTRRFTRSALKLMPTSAIAYKTKKKDKPFEITSSCKLNEKVKMPPLIEQDKPEEVIPPSVASNTILQENLVEIPIFLSNFGEPDFDKCQMYQLLKEKFEGPVPVTVILGVTDDNEKEASVDEYSFAVTRTRSCVGPAEFEGLKADTNEVFIGGLNLSSKKKMELKMSKKIALTKPPSNVRELLSTGFLEGLPVKYISCPGKNVGIHGIIMGNGVLCFCTYCHGTKVVSAYQFEIHAGSTKKHPSDFIFLQNGKSIREVLRLCNGASIDMLESAIKNAIGPLPIKKLSICQRCKRG